MINLPPMRKDRTLLATHTGEPFQPARLYYAIPSKAVVARSFRNLRCMDDDAGNDRWVWLYTDEAARLEFARPRAELPDEVHPIVIGVARFPPSGGMQQGPRHTLMAPSDPPTGVPTTPRSHLPIPLPGSPTHPDRAFRSPYQSPRPTPIAPSDPRTRVPTTPRWHLPIPLQGPRQTPIAPSDPPTRSENIGPFDFSHPPRRFPATVPTAGRTERQMAHRTGRRR